jgi:4-hydroxyphenylpyruvate dioxygenase
VRSRAARNADGSVRFRAQRPGRRRREHRAPARGVRDARRVRRRRGDARARRAAADRAPATTTTTSPARTALARTRSRRMRGARRPLRGGERGRSCCHFYTAMASASLFFEVLERRGGYDGYGASNSPVRMAATDR